ncbi:NAD(P)/FAD-dependent oxidoreductase [Methylococcus sp. EFPC2]|uniref:NAD(P)/FAD-dependent oxidoreductase n=1 Tax=Methylococcus sp. EFPC2 TaxID=2812648 RepID=UPI001967C095|nr:NAD(P)/FAD-dependent oxidoreductase [Methylococcus sp. EFPC2]QSA98874.1 tryptophan 7-halogenase [Methylococcus sp. EFPC2]
MSTTTRKTFDYDVVVAGGGPAGSTAATLLAQHGHKVLLLEKDSHPRFHIGESQLPFSEPVVERLGIDWSANNQFKNGAVFIDEKTGQRMHFPLSAQRRTFQIERGPFDQLLFENAAAHGAETRQREKVLEVEYTEAAVDVVTDQARIRSRYFVDATGRSALLGRKRRSISRIENLGRFAVYCHYEHIAQNEEADELFRTGNIYIPVVDIGWFWIIPLSGRRLSVGLVVQKEKPAGMAVETLFQNYVEQSPILGRLLDGARAYAPIRTEADFSYTNQQRYGVRYACCGDAAGFLDPVFSSGVFLAFTSAARIADRVDVALKEGNEADPHLHADDDSEYRLGFDTMRAFVERFYQSDMVHNMFFEADKHPHTQEEISRLLAGDLWSGDNQLQNSLLSRRRVLAGNRP